MRVLIDACVPRKLKPHIVGHVVSTAHELGLNALPDGALLDAADGLADVIVTADRNLPFQRNLSGRNFFVIVVRAYSNRLADLLPMVPDLLLAIDGGTAGNTYEVGP